MKQLLQQVLTLQAMGQSVAFTDQMTYRAETLIIRCADWRLGDVLLSGMPNGCACSLQTLGNVIPPYGSSQATEGEMLRHALNTLRVKDIVVLGHTDCGALNRILSGSRLGDTSESLWHKATQGVQDAIQRDYMHLPDNERLLSAAEENVVRQLNHLLTYPVVGPAFINDLVKLHGWLYVAEENRMMRYDRLSDSFKPLAMTDTNLRLSLQASN